jgi:hypothetical protein
MLRLLLPFLAAFAPTSSHPIDVQIVVAHGLYLAEAQVATTDAWMQFTNPIAYRGQVPGAIVVTSDPPDKVQRIALENDGADRLLRVYFRPLIPGEKVLVRSNTFVFLHREKQPTGEGVALPTGTDVPPDVKKYLEPTPGVDAADARIQKIAKAIPRRDLAGFVDDVMDYLSKNVKEGTGPQGALDVLERGSASSAGCANLAAALFIASKIPARILACSTIETAHAERYIVEAWTQKLGWAKLDPTLHTFPLDDSLHVILRVIDPTAKRTDGTPIAQPTGHGVSCALGIVAPATGWLSAERIENQQAPEDELEAIEIAARKAWDALVDKPVNASRVVLVPSAKAPAAVKARGKKLLELLESRLDK